MPNDITAGAPWFAGAEQPRKSRFEELLEQVLASQNQPLNITLPQLPAEEPMPQPPEEPHGFWNVLNRRFLPGLAAGLEGRPAESVFEEERRPYRQAMEQWQLKSGVGQQRFGNQAALMGLQAQLANLNQSRAQVPLTIAEMMQRSQEAAAGRQSEASIRQMLLNAEREQQGRQQEFLAGQGDLNRENALKIAEMTRNWHQYAADQRAQKKSGWMQVIASLFKPDPIKGGVVPPDEGTLGMFLRMAVADGAIDDAEALALHKQLYPDIAAPAAAPQGPGMFDRVRSFLTPFGAPSKPLRRLGPTDQPQF